MTREPPPILDDINIEEMISSETDLLDPRKVKVTCPGCGRTFSPLCSDQTVVREEGWRWVGIDHREPYCTFLTTHHPTKCGQTMRFTTYIPQ